VVYPSGVSRWPSRPQRSTSRQSIPPRADSRFLASCGRRVIAVIALLSIATKKPSEVHLCPRLALPLGADRTRGLVPLRCTKASTPASLHSWAGMPSAASPVFRPATIAHPSAIAFSACRPTGPDAVFWPPARIHKHRTWPCTSMKLLLGDFMAQLDRRAICLRFRSARRTTISGSGLRKQQPVPTPGPSP